MIHAAGPDSTDRDLRLLCHSARAGPAPGLWAVGGDSAPGPGGSLSLGSVGTVT